MVVLRTGIDGAFITIEARVAQGVDEMLMLESGTGRPVRGIDVHIVDQRVSACLNESDGACWAIFRRVRRVPPQYTDPTVKNAEATDSKPSVYVEG